MPQLTALEMDLMDSVVTLKSCRWIAGTALTLGDLLNPVEEQKIGASPYDFLGGDEEIMAQAVQEVNEGSRMIEDSGSEDGSDNEVDDSVDLPYHEGAELCERLEKACVVHCNTEGVSVLDLQTQLRKL